MAKELIPCARALLAATLVALVAPRPAISQPLQASSFDEASQDITRSLNSTDPRTVAWGAYSAGAYRVHDSIPLLQRILEYPPQGTPLERRAVVDVVLDALIQLNASMPGELVARYIEEQPVQTIILLANARDRGPILLELVDTVAGFKWYAAANLLLASDRAALATHLVNTVHLALTVSVSDDDTIGPGSGSALGNGVGDGFGETPWQYPPHAEYRFEDAARPGLTVLAAGPRTVYYSRTVTTTLQFGVSEVGIDGPTDADRLAYMRAMLAQGHQTPRAETFESIRWKTADALLERVEELRQVLIRQYRSLVGDLVRSYRLSIDADTLTVPITVRLVDHRTDRSVALPAIQ